LADWQAIRADADIQFTPTPPAPPSQPPAWLDWLGGVLQDLLGPIGEALGIGWPVIETVLLVLAVLLAGWLGWRVLVRLARRGSRAESREAGWRPAPEAARSLLSQADLLAAEGQFAEAVHLLLRRSVEQITMARPALLHPASTAREIAVDQALPEPARRAFTTIAARVERSRFALRDLDAADWQVARAAYADFALQDFGGEA